MTCKQKPSDLSAEDFGTIASMACLLPSLPLLHHCFSDPHSIPAFAHTCLRSFIRLVFCQQVCLPDSSARVIGLEKASPSALLNHDLSCQCIACSMIRALLDVCLIGQHRLHSLLFASSSIPFVVFIFITIPANISLSMIFVQDPA